MSIRSFSQWTSVGLAGIAVAGCKPDDVVARKTEFAHRLRGQPAPDFVLPNLDGQPVRLSEFRGKPVLLAFWAYG